MTLAVGFNPRNIGSMTRVASATLEKNVGQYSIVADATADPCFATVG